MWTWQEVAGAALLILTVVNVLAVVFIAIFLKLDNDTYSRKMKKRNEKPQLKVIYPDDQGKIDK